MILGYKWATKTRVLINYKKLVINIAKKLL
jgi:hypothetical protein